MDTKYAFFSHRKEAFENILVTDNKTVLTSSPQSSGSSNKSLNVRNHFYF